MSVEIIEGEHPLFVLHTASTAYAFCVTAEGLLRHLHWGGPVRADDMIVCLGAGDITKWAAGLADAIRARRGG